MYLNQLFTDNSNAQSLINHLIDSCKTHTNYNKTLLDFHCSKFGDLTINELIEKYKVKKIIHENYNLEPLTVIATVHEPYYCSPINSFDIILKEKSNIKRIIDTSIKKDPEYFFKGFNENRTDKPTYYMFNDIYNRKFAAILQGHHRTIIGSFLQMYDAKYFMKDVRIIEYYIDWRKVQTRQTLYNKIMKSNPVFDYKIFCKLLGKVSA